ncbi:MAG: arsenite methyltransferase [Candidatus Aminicenantales bacterium]
MAPEKIKDLIRKSYGRIATQGTPCCAPEVSGHPGSCCPDSGPVLAGYKASDLEGLPEGLNLGLGCGHPVALASLQKGETVLDLGSGPGLDCLLAAREVGEAGKVIGVDMTPEMVERARGFAQKGAFPNVEFRLGDIENLPLEADCVDVVLSNCVINLAADKKRVFSEAYRVLKPRGRLVISDIVLDASLPEPVRESQRAYVACVAGALLKDDYLAALEAAGFRGVRILAEKPFALSFPSDPGKKPQREKITVSLISLSLKAHKPKGPSAAR